MAMDSINKTKPDSSSNSAISHVKSGLSSIKSAGSSVWYFAVAAQFGSYKDVGKTYNINNDVNNMDVSINSYNSIINLENSETKRVFDHGEGNTYIVNKGVSPEIFLNEGSKVIDKSNKDVTVDNFFANNQAIEHYGDHILKLNGFKNDISVINHGNGMIFIPNSKSCNSYEEIRQKHKQQDKQKVLPDQHFYDSKASFGIEGSGDIVFEKEPLSVLDTSVVAPYLGKEHIYDKANFTTNGTGKILLQE